MGLKNNPRAHEDVIYATVLADGKIHVGVTEDTEGAVERKYATEADKKAGPDVKTGVKWEVVYTELSGIIKKVDFHEGDYGINLLVTVADEEAEEGEKPVTLALPTSSNFGEDMMKKLPNVDLKLPVVISPYSFEDKGKKKRGMYIVQVNKKGEKEKIANFYYDVDKKKNINGYPQPIEGKKGKAPTKSEWRKYFGEARDFMIEDLKERLEIEDEESEADKTYNAM